MGKKKPQNKTPGNPAISVWEWTESSEWSLLLATAPVTALKHHGHHSCKADGPSNSYSLPKKKKKGSFLGLHALASLCKWPELPCLPEASRNRAHNAVRRIACSRLPCYGYPLQTLPTWLRMQCSQSLLASARAGGQPPRGRDLLSAPSAGLKLQPGRSQSHLTKEYLRFVNKKQSCCYSSLSYWLAAP